MPRLPAAPNERVKRTKSSAQSTTKPTPVLKVSSLDLDRSRLLLRHMLLMVGGVLLGKRSSLSERLNEPKNRYDVLRVDLNMCIELLPSTIIVVFEIKMLFNCVLLFCFQIKRCKEVIRECVKVCDEAEGDVAIDKTLFDEDGELDMEHIFCSKCRGQECTDVRCNIFHRLAICFSQ